MDSSEYHSICDFLSNSIYPDDLQFTSSIFPRNLNRQSMRIRKWGLCILEANNRFARYLVTLSSIRKALIHFKEGYM